MRRILPIILLFLTACGGPNLASVELEPLLVQDGDLPTGVTAGQVIAGDVGATGTAYGYVQRVQRNLSPGGVVIVILYDNDEALNRDFAALLPGVTADGRPTTEVGTRAMERTNAIVFIRCHALASVRLQDYASALSYAKRLDKRLMAVVC